MVLQRTIDGLLEFSRMEAGRVRLNLEEVSLSAIAHEVASKLAPLVEEGEPTRPWLLSFSRADAG